jgi:hypothetical protein
MLRLLLSTITIALIIIIAGFGNVMAQCDPLTTIIIGGVDVDPCDPGTVRIPINMTNDCPVGGFSIEVRVTDPSWLIFDPDDSLSADTIGSRISGFGYFGWEILPTYHNQITVTALGPGGSQTFLPPGEGLIFSVTLHRAQGLADSCQLMNFGSIDVSDSLGLNSFPTQVVRDYVCINPCPDSLIRGDANNSGGLNGLDVTYLVSYFKGQASLCTGCPCLGDANNSGNVNGLDVVFLVAYFKGLGPAPDPAICE